MQSESPPQHVAIIMDGNGRWSSEHGVSIIQGHRSGAENIRAISKTAHEIGIKYLTLYTFSTENWRRPKIWVDQLMSLLKHYLRHEIKDLVKNNVRLEVIGDLNSFDSEISHLIEEARAKTSGCTGLTIILALSYGARTEITHAAKQIAIEIAAGRLRPEDISQELFASHLYTTAYPDPDLIIRTSGEHRISNFLLWQSAYSEFVFSDKLWPDFTPQDFKDALNQFYRRDRRYGAAIAS